MVPAAQWVGQEGSETVSMGSQPSLYLHFYRNCYDKKS